MKIEDIPPNGSLEALKFILEGFIEDMMNGDSLYTEYEKGVDEVMDQYCTLGYTDEPYSLEPIKESFESIRLLLIEMRTSLWEKRSQYPNIEARILEVASIFQKKMGNILAITLPASLAMNMISQLYHANVFSFRE